MVDRIRNDALNAGITPDKCSRLKRVSELSRLLYGEKDELSIELEKLAIGCEEGFYSPDTMTWKDNKGGEHSQRCNARKIAEDSGSVLADGTTIY